MTVQRRLAAIMAADMVGYSRLMEADEAGTIARQKAYREKLIDPQLAEHGGRIVKTTGDGLLVEFASVVDAVGAAAAVQQAMAAREADMPEERRIRYRVGINLGDIVIDGDDILGDGVNLAARLEGLAQPGGICLSAIVHQSVAGKLDLAFEDIGEQKVKNIETPVHVFRVVLEGAVAAAPALALPDKPSIAVLPFDNLGGDPEQEYFADGITEEIITALARIEDLFVIARNSTFTYKGRAVDIREVAKELGVRFVLEGSVRRAGNRVRITGQLIEAETGHHVWAERYDRDLDDIFAVQDEITRMIAGALGPKITEATVARALAKEPSSVGAFDHFVRALGRFPRQTRVDNQAAREEAKAAIVLDSNYSRAYGVLAWTHLAEAWHAWSDDPARSLAAAHETAQKSVSLDQTDLWGNSVLGYTELWMKRHDRALSILQRMIDFNPNNADGHALLGGCLNFMGRPQEGLVELEAAVRLNPHHPPWYYQLLGRSYLMLGRHREAVDVLQRTIDLTPEYAIGRALLAATYVAMDRLEDAHSEVAKIRDMSPDFTLAHAAKVVPYQDPDTLESYLEMLRKAGLSD